MDVRVVVADPRRAEPFLDQLEVWRPGRVAESLRNHPVHAFAVSHLDVALDNGAPVRAEQLG